MSESNITIRQLVTFREVMRTGSISQAASGLGRTQPAISTAIANLEKELGFFLFTREHGKLAPTPEANYFLEECEGILDRLDRTQRVIARVRDLESGHLRIACHPAAANLFIPSLLNEFLADKSDVKLTMVMRASAVVEHLISSQQFDIGLAETPPPRNSILARDFGLECVCVLPRNDPLAEHREITPALLDGKPLATLFAEHPTTIQTEQAFLATGYRLRKQIELRTFLPGLQFVAAGRCYMICDMITAFSHVLHGPEGQSLTVRPFAPRVVSNVSILMPAHRTPSLLTSAFADHLEARLQDLRKWADF